MRECRIPLPPLPCAGVGQAGEVSPEHVRPSRPELVTLLDALLLEQAIDALRYALDNTPASVHPALRLVHQILATEPAERGELCP